MTRIVVTGIGLVLPGADTKEVFWDHLVHGRSQLSMEEDPNQPGNRFAVGRVQNFDPNRYLGEVSERFRAHYPHEIALYLSSIYNARNDAGIDLGALDAARVGIFDGVARPSLGFWYDRIRREALDAPDKAWSRKDLKIALPGQAVGLAASLLKVRGPAYTYTSTCSSGAVAIGHAFRELQSGAVDVAFASGHEAPLLPPLFAMYDDAGLISKERNNPGLAVSPFVNHSNNAFGEGAVTLVLETYEHAMKRGATILAEMGGYSYGNNGYHPTSIDVLGVRPTEVIQALLDNAKVTTDDVGFVVGHGNGVRRSDLSEENYMRRLFDERAADVPLVSVKPIFGHSLGCSSATNAAAVVMMLHNNHVASTINVDPKGLKRWSCHSPSEGSPEPQGLGVAMSYGMGGQNAALLFSRGELAQSGGLRNVG